MGSFCSGVLDRVEHDVVDVVVGDGIDGLAAASLPYEQVGAPQDPQVLGHQRLGGAGRLDEFVDAAGAIDQRHQHGQAQGVRHRLEQLGAVGERFVVVAGREPIDHLDIVTSQYGNVNMFRGVEGLGGGLVGIP